MLEDILTSEPKTVNLEGSSINVIHSAKKQTKTLKEVLLIGIISYAMIVSLLYLFQEKLLFLPTSLDQNYGYEFKHDFEELFFKTEDEAFINAIHFKVESPKQRKGVILYFHGNAGNLSRWGTIAEDFVGLDYDVLIMDYRTYGKSQGKLSEKAFYKDAQYCYDYLLKNYNQNEIILYGRSLGTGIASFVAANNKPKQLILETPYYNIADVAQSRFPIFPVKLLLKYNFPNNQHLLKVDCPVTIFHGTEDNVVPYTSGKKLLELNKKKHRLHYYHRWQA